MQNEQPADPRTRIADLLHLLADEIAGLVTQGNGTGEVLPTGAGKPQDEDRWLTPEETATFLSLTVPQLQRRNIPGKKTLGRRTVRYSLAALRRYLSRN